MAALCETQEELQLKVVSTCSTEDKLPLSRAAHSKPYPELQLNGVVHSMAYCKETRDILLCDSFNWTIEPVSRSSTGLLSLQPQKLVKLSEQQIISNPTSVQIAGRMGKLFIGCDSNKGIYVLDRKNLRLDKKFAQNMNRDFDYMVVDETEYPQRCTVFASSVNSGKLTKFDYNSGSMVSELSVKLPGNILLKDKKLYLICQKDSTECVLVIDTHSLKIQSKFTLSGCSSLGGLCLDERGNVYVTAWNESNHRIIYSLGDGGKVVKKVLLPEFDEDAYVLDMVAADKYFIMLIQEPGPEFSLKQITF